MKRLRIVGVFALVAVLAFGLMGCASNDYKPELKSSTVNSPTIGEDGVLRVGVNTAKSPLAGMGNDKIIGIDVDIAAAMADELGLKLSIIDVGTTPATAISENKVDIVMGIDSSDSLEGVWLSDEYLPTGVALFALAGSNAQVPTANSNSASSSSDANGGEASSVKIVAQTSSKSAWAVTNAYGDNAIESTQDLADAFDKLAAKDVDLLASDAIIGMYAANRHGVDVEIVAMLGPQSGYCIGAAEKNTELQGVIKETLSKLMENGTIGVIEQKWLGDPLDLSDVPNATETSSSSSSASSNSSSAATTD